MQCAAPCYVSRPLLPCKLCGAFAVAATLWRAAFCVIIADSLIAASALKSLEPPLQHTVLVQHHAGQPSYTAQAESVAVVNHAARSCTPHLQASTCLFPSTVMLLLF